MKINKKLLMAALAGAIVVTGGVGSFADGEIPKKVDDSGNPLFKDHNLKGSENEKETETEETETTNDGIPTAVVDKAPDGSDNPMFKYDDFDDQANPRFETENNEFEEEKDVSDNWFNPAEHPFKEEKQGKNPGITIDEWLKLQKEKEKNPGITIDEWLKLQKEKEETPEKPEVQNGFETEKEAIAAAKKALENNKMNNTYSVRQGADGKYYYVLGYEHKPLVTIDEWLANNTPEEEGKISDNWYDQSKHPFEEGKEDGKTPDVTPTPGETTPSTPAEPSTPGETTPSTPGETTPSTPGETTPSTPDETTPSTPGETTPSTPGEGQKPEEGKPGKEEKPEKEDKPAKEEKENTDSPNKKEKEEDGKGGVDSPSKKEKAALPKAGSEAEILTLAAASLSSVAGAFISLKKRK